MLRLWKMQWILLRMLAAHAQEVCALHKLRLDLGNSRQTVQVIREVIELSTVKWTSTITAPWSPGSGYTNWTCRASHITTWYPPPTTLKHAVLHAAPTTPISPVAGAMSKAYAAAPTSIPLPLPRGPGPFLYDTAALAHVQETFDKVSGGMQVGGRRVVAREQYLAFFNVSGSSVDGNGDAFAQSVLDKFHAHDQDGDGYLTLQEIQLFCDQSGCLS